MAKTIKRDERIQQIKAAITQCEAYMKMDPDPAVTDRVTKLESNSCLEGMYYLNAIYKDMQYERSTSEAIKYLETLYINIPYESSQYIMPGYIIRNQGFWQKQKLEGPFNSVNSLKLRINELTNEGLISSVDFTAYINVNFIINQIAEKTLAEYNPKIEIENQRVPIKYKIVSSILDPIFIDYLETTSSILIHLENPSPLELIARST